jgi:hypothetical protein
LLLAAQAMLLAEVNLGVTAIRVRSRPQMLRSTEIGADWL